MTSIKKDEGRPNEPKSIFDVAQDFEACLIEHYTKSERRAWLVVRWFGVFTALALFALASLAPFYKIVPLTFQVDKLTGDAQLVKLDGQAITPTEAIDKHWVAEYVIHRERFVWTLVQLDFDYVMNQSDERVARDYRTIYDGVQARDKKLGPGTDERIKDIVVTLPPGEPGKAVVRFVKVTRKDGQDVESVHYIATLAYKYEPPSVLSRERAVVDNPMGFKVTGYVVDRDVSGAPLVTPPVSNGSVPVKPGGFQ